MAVLESVHHVVRLESYLDEGQRRVVLSLEPDRGEPIGGLEVAVSSALAATDPRCAALLAAVKLGQRVRVRVDFGGDSGGSG